MKTELEPLDLIVWRHTHKLTQTRLAKLLSRDRKTVGRWESGVTRMPPDLAQQLEHLAFTLAPKPAVVAPERLNPGSATLRPDLKLYFKVSPAQWSRDSEHPIILAKYGYLALDLPEASPVAWSVLETPEYVAAVEAWRAKGESAISAKWKKYV